MRFIHDVENDPAMKLFYCPGCKVGHYIVTEASGGRPVWTWNGSYDRPTVSPSIRVMYSGADAGVDGAPQKCCHFFVREGQIEYCSDSTHELSGKTVPMEEWP